MNRPFNRRLPWKPFSLAIAAFFVAGAQGVLAGSRDLPTLWIIGDSTVNNASKGLEGWGSELHRFFDSRRIKIENRAEGGRSSRSFLEGGGWQKVLHEIRAGDFVLMQFGHNDSGGEYFKGKAKASIHGTGDESKEGVMPDGSHVVVHSYGWYLRRYIADAVAKKALPIVVSPIPRNRWSDDGKVFREGKGYGLWAKESAQQMKVPFLDLNSIVANHYDKMGAEKVKEFFPNDWTHTNSAGARFNAQCVVQGLMETNSPLKRYMYPSSKLRRLFEEY